MNLINEDEYWERKREEWENPKAFRKRNPWDEEEPIYEDGTIFLDEEIEEIEKKGDGRWLNYMRAICWKSFRK